jgi:hypothetical protein
VKKHKGSTVKSKTFMDAEGAVMLDEYVKLGSVAKVHELHPEYSPQTITNRIKRALNSQGSIAAAQHRKLQDLHLDQLTDRLMPRLESPDDGVFFQAAATYLRVMERRAKLHGMDAPSQIQVETTAVEPSKETKAFVSTVQERLAAIAERSGPPALKAVES